MKFSKTFSSSALSSAFLAAAVCQSYFLNGDAFSISKPRSGSREILTSSSASVSTLTLFESSPGADLMVKTPELESSVPVIDSKENTSSDSDEAGTDNEKDEIKDEDSPPLPPLVLCEVPPASYSINTVEKSESSPSAVTTLTVHLGAPGHPDPLVFETGKVGRQAAGAVMLTRGETVVYATASRDKDPKENIDFLPLSVDHGERFSSAGLTSGSYNRRDGRPAEHEILTCRLIDRPIRPLVEPGWRHETQLLSWVMSYDGLRSCDSLAITTSAAALWISDVPLQKPVSAVIVGRVDDQFVLNPTNEQMERSSLHLTMAGTKEAVLMIEGVADFLPEEIMVDAISFGHTFIKHMCEALEEFGKIAGKEKMYSTIPPKIVGLDQEVAALMGDKVGALYDMDSDKTAFSTQMSVLSKEVWALLEEKYPENKNDVKSAFKTLTCAKMFQNAKNTGTRCDGRKLDEVRPIFIESGIFPRVHGSALFTRGETQAIATVTLGDSGMKQKIDKLDGLEKKRFYLQYTFPPSCVGETGRVGAPGRREVGHGNLAERALASSLPSEKAFPYSIRVESLITESNGSSSMASVCGGCLSLMDAGVPIKNPIAGIAMGMLLGDKKGTSDDNSVILSDILGVEDALGTMDFKVAGDREGITAFQLDIKCEGLDVETMKRALEQAKQGRLHILDKMAENLSKPRDELPLTVPRIGSFKIPESLIGKVIGPGGKQIRAVIEDFDLINMDVQEDGTIQLTSLNTEKLAAAEKFVKALTSDDRGGRGGGGNAKGRPEYVGPEAIEGMTYKGKITGIHNFGVFVEIMPGAEDGSTPGLEGLCHVSELHTERIRNCEAFMNSLGYTELEVKYLGKNQKGKLQLSRKAVLEEKQQGGEPKKELLSPSNLGQDEIDVIAKAIEGV